MGDGVPVSGWGVIAEFGEVSGVGFGDVDEPFAGFGMEVYLGERVAGVGAAMDAKKEVTVGGAVVEAAQVFEAEVPVGEEPEGIAGG